MKIKQRENGTEIDGSSGVKLLSVELFEFDETDLDVTVKDVKSK